MTATTETTGSVPANDPKTNESSSNGNVQDVPPGSIAKMRMLQERYKDGSLETVAREEYRAIDFDKNVGYAVVALESYKEDGSLDQYTLKIHSPHLLTIFKTVIVSHPSVQTTFDRPFSLKAPFHMLIHAWDDLDDYRQKLTDSTAEEAAHLDVLLDFMRHEMAKERQRCLDARTKQCIAFDDLWMIYRPGDVLNKPDHHHISLLRLDNTAYEYESCSGWRFELHCSRAFFDGKKTVRRKAVVTIFESRHIPGKTLAKITNLPAYPLSFAELDADYEAKLEQRGTKYVSATGAPCMYYDGMAEFCKSPPQSFFHWEMDSFQTIWLPTTETARIVLDPQTFLEDFGKERESIQGDFGLEFQGWAKKRFGSFERALKLLSPAYAYGYSLQNKRWCKYYVDNILPVEWNESALETLILPSSEKSLLSALVKSHKFPKDARDVTAQKGKGLVILLHGTPGSGKTLTAEVSAELAHAPLMSISLRELYEYEYFNEHLLKMYLTYATIWHAVVLIDEADVFLETRTTGEKTSAERNALVAVFLRYLEYFSGVIFLTSNRVEDFDQAVKSRIHLALQYEPPAAEVRTRIWTERLSALGTDIVGLDLAKEVPTLVQHDMNGREISNMINTALTLARSEVSMLEMKHLVTVIKVWETFNHNLAKLHAEKDRRRKQGLESLNTIVAAGDL